MTQREGFASGFLAGAILGGIVGGILGSIVANRRDMELSPGEEAKLNGNSLEPKKDNGKKRQIRATTSEMDMEMTRRSLEEKISQLNATIDEVREQLGNVNSNSVPIDGERTTNS